MTDHTPEIFVRSDHANNAVVFWTTDPERANLTTGAAHAGTFLPKGTYPTAVLGEDGGIVRITADPLPDATVLRAALATLQRPYGRALASLNDEIAPGDIVAIDASGSTDERFTTALAQQFANRGIEVLLARHDVTPYSGGDVRGQGGFTPQFLVDHIEARDSAAKVFVFTDGFGPGADPVNPARWTWILPHGGLDWMTRRGAGAVWHVAADAWRA